MSYIVLARKWRPMKFEEVVGQEHITRTLMNALEQNRIAHAFIFAGPRGIGKTTTARILAKAVNCENQPAINPCNQCKSCKAITAGQSLDMIEIDGASNRGIDEIRNLRENIRFSPASARYKVYIIDEVHMLSKEAFNALLKTLEEPPAHAMFIFATTEIHRVPLTILSRCQRFDFQRIATSRIVEQLKYIADNENIEIDEESLSLIARKSEGSMRDATSVLDQITSFSKAKVTVETLQESLGIIKEDLFFEYTTLMQQKNDAEIIQFAQKIYQQGHDYMNFMQGLEEHFRNFLVTCATGSAKLLETADHIKSRYEKESTAFTGRDLLHYLDILTQHENMLKFSENPQLILELLLLKLAHKPISTDIEELLTLLKDQTDESGGSGNPASSPKPSAKSESSESRSTPQEKPIQNPSPPPHPPSPSTAVKETSKDKFAALNKVPLPTHMDPGTAREQVTEKTSPQATAQVELREIAAKWSDIIEAVKKGKIALASFLQDGVPYKIDKNSLYIAFDPKTGFHKEHVQKNAAVIEKILKDKFQFPLKIKCIQVDFEKNGIQKHIQSPEETFEKVKEKEPVLKKIIELFDCENLDSA